MIIKFKLSNNLISGSGVEINANVKTARELSAVQSQIDAYIMAVYAQLDNDAQAEPCALEEMDGAENED